MKCAQCGSSQTYVVNSREIINGTRRRRECGDCGCRFTTYEFTKEDMERFAVRVLKENFPARVAKAVKEEVVRQISLKG